ncbi:glycosyltransferase family 8 protein, partial [Bacteroides fragilis]|nr:glycosyltransferase family 8 protein [Bacteroides fragilis]
KIKLIPNIYNFTTSETLHTPEMLSGIIIIHYTGSIKPWHQEYTWQVLKELYCKYNSSMNKIKDRLLSRWMERTIELFQLSQKTNDTELEKAADHLLNKIIDHCSLAVPITYENGLCGIGTGIEYLLYCKRNWSKAIVMKYYIK